MFELKTLRDTPFSTHPVGNTSAPASHLDGRRGRRVLSGTHSSIFSLRAGPDMCDERVSWWNGSPHLTALSTIYFSGAFFVRRTLRKDIRW